MKVNCDYCGKEFDRRPSNIKTAKHHFCSRLCQGKWKSKTLRGENSPQWKGGKKVVRCDWCGKEVERIHSQVKRAKHHFCTIQCHAAWRSENIKCENSNHWQGGKIEKICPVCNEKFEVWPSRIKRGQGKYCSYKCARKAQKIPTHQTKPEVIFEEICEKNNLPFKYVGDGQLWIGKKSETQLNPDFVECNSKKVAIEIFSYWHDSLIRHCKVRYSQTYGGRKKILKKYGWKLVVFWQEDLEREDAETFVLNSLKKEGLLP